jgi:hypothetical protein
MKAIKINVNISGLKTILGSIIRNPVNINIHVKLNGNEKSKFRFRMKKASKTLSNPTKILRP